MIETHICNYNRIMKSRIYFNTKIYKCLRKRVLYNENSDHVKFTLSKFFKFDFPFEVQYYSEL